MLACGWSHLHVDARSEAVRSSDAVVPRPLLAATALRSLRLTFLQRHLPQHFPCRGDGVVDIGIAVGG